METLGSILEVSERSSIPAPQNPKPLSMGHIPRFRVSGHIPLVIGWIFLLRFNAFSSNLGALIINRIFCWPLYYNHNKEPPA